MGRYALSAIALLFSVSITATIAATIAAANDAMPFEFIEQHCVDCHNADEVNGSVRLDNLDQQDLNDHKTVLFFERVLRAIQTGTMPPQDAEILSQDERESVSEQIHSTLMKKTRTGGTVLRRLNRSEYEQSIQDIFGIEYRVPDGFPADSNAHGFDNSGEGLVLSAPLMEAYYHAAISVADKLLPPPKRSAPSKSTKIDANELVISYSSGAIIDGAMRLAASTDTMWRSSTWPENFEVKTAGTYRIKVSSSQFKTESKAWPTFDEPMKLQILARSLNDKDGDPVSKQRLLVAFDVTQNSPKDFEAVVELYPSETPVFFFANAPINGDRTRKAELEKTLRFMFDNDPKLLAGWATVKHGNGLRGGLGWDRVKAIRDRKDLNLDSIDLGDKVVDQLIKKMASNPGLYVETVIYQFFEEGPALQIHHVDIEGPLSIVQSPAEAKQAEVANKFLGSRQGMNTTEYVQKFMRRFLTDTFRRPVRDDVLTAYADLVSKHVEQGHELNEGLHLAIRTALMSPHFLYRGHRDGRLDNYDLATRLSYFLTGGPPDETLLAAAAKNELRDLANLEKQTKRLLRSRQLSLFVSNFTGQWLGLRELHDIMPDERLFPKFTDQHRDAMISETELFFTEILKENLPVEQFIKPDFTFLNKRMADEVYLHKNFKGKGEKLVRVDLKSNSLHGGLLGQASVMMATANGVDTQPVVRGVWVLENILGDPTMDPPDDVPALTPDTRRATTVRETLALHRSDDNCESCHRRIDPLGFVLENFDPVGRWRTHYPKYSTNKAGKTSVEEGAKIETFSEISDSLKFKDVNDLKTYVVDNIDQFTECLSLKLLTYANGRVVSYAEKQEVRQIIERVHKSGNGFQDLLVELVKSEAFRTK